jgi:hypothetical protein
LLERPLEQMRCSVILFALSSGDIDYYLNLIADVYRTLFYFASVKDAIRYPFGHLNDKTAFGSDNSAGIAGLPA